MLARIRAIRENESGFTLIELLIVIVILGVLSGIVVFSVSGITDRGAVAACKSDKKSVEVASEAYFAQTGAYAAGVSPATINILVTAKLLHSAPPVGELITLTSAGVVASTFTGCT
jgi:prepilin-type N-terminal cleavage/methylation domain-containing protein